MNRLLLPVVNFFQRPFIKLHAFTKFHSFIKNNSKAYSFRKCTTSGCTQKKILKLGFSGDLGKLGKFGQNGRPLKTRQNFENFSVEKNERVKTAISDQKKS